VGEGRKFQEQGEPEITRERCGRGSGGKTLAGGHRGLRAAVKTQGTVNKERQWRSGKGEHRGNSRSRVHTTVKKCESYKKRKGKRGCFELGQGCRAGGKTEELCSMNDVPSGGGNQFYGWEKEQTKLRRWVLSKRWEARNIGKGRKTKKEVPPTEGGGPFKWVLRRIKEG